MAENNAHYAVNTYSYTMSHTAERCLAHLGDKGYRAFEMMMYPGHAWPPAMDAAARKALRGQIERGGFRLVSVNMPNIDVNIAGASEEMRSYSLGLVRQFVQMAGELGAEGLVLGVGKSNPLFPMPYDQLKGHCFAALDQLVPLAAKSGTQIWIENMPFSFISKVKDVMAMLAEYGSDDLGFVYDLANGAFVGEDLAEGIETVRSRLKLVHLSDTPKDVYKHDPVGGGIVDFAKAAKKLIEIGYDRPPVLEIISFTPDPDIDASTDKLNAMGWAKVNA